MQASQQQQQQQPISEAPGGEMLASKSQPETEATRVGLGLGQGLHPHTLSKSQLKKQQRKQAKQQGQQQPPMQAPSMQHYKEKAPAQDLPQKEVQSPVSEGISEQSSLEQRMKYLSETEKEKQRMAQQETPTTTPQQVQQPKSTSAVSLEPPLLSQDEKARQLQARKEVERLEENERRDRIARAQREDMMATARREANLMGVVREEEAERQRRIEEDERLANREGEREASLMGTVIDEERERQRRIEEDYPTYSEPLEKTKAMEEIERRRRVYSQAEKSRQKLAAASCAKLFPKAPRPSLAESKLWTASGVLKRESPLPPMESKARYGQFIATTTKVSSTHTPATTLHTKHVGQPYSSTKSELTIEASQPSAVQLKVVETGPGAELGSEKLGPALTRTICKETYRSQTRPRLVVHHTGLSGKWQRHTETVELHEGVDF